MLRQNGSQVIEMRPSLYVLVAGTGGNFYSTIRIWRLVC